MTPNEETAFGQLLISLIGARAQEVQARDACAIVAGPLDTASKSVADTVSTIVSPPLVVTDIARPRNPNGVAGPSPTAITWPTFTVLPPAYTSRPKAPGEGTDVTAEGSSTIAWTLDPRWSKRP